MVMTVVEDPTYLAIPFVTTSHFKKIADCIRLGSRAVHGPLIGKSLPLELETWLQMIRTFWTLQSKVEDSLKKHKLTPRSIRFIGDAVGAGGFESAGTGQ